MLWEVGFSIPEMLWSFHHKLEAEIPVKTKTAFSSYRELSLPNFLLQRRDE